MNADYEIPKLPIHTALITGITMPLLSGIKTPAELLAHHARVSSTANQYKHESGAKLIRRLIERKEPSPLEQIALNFQVHTTRDMSHQMIRHWSLRPQEFSGRYAEMDSTLYLRECRLQHPTDRQMSVELDMSIAGHRDLDQWWKQMQEDLHARAQDIYRIALDNGIAKECARAVLPEGNTGTMLYFNGRLRDWYFYCAQRSELKTQKEHRSIANSVWPQIVEHFPMLGDMLPTDSRSA